VIEILGLFSVSCKVAAALIGLCLGATFTRGQRRKWPILRALDGKQLALFLLTASLLVFGELSTYLEARAKEYRDYQLAEEQHKEILEAITGLGIPSPPRSPETLKDVDTERLNAAVSIAMNAEEQFTNKKFVEALERFKRADSLTDIAAIKARIADSYFHLGEYEEAIRFEQMAIDLSPNWSGPYYMKAFSLMRLGRVQEAIAPAQRSCELGFVVACELVEDLRKMNGDA